ncbi:MAG: DUF4957 domain-containing protein [Bacteroidales bacterium]|nr:DUF4957 domain-containing protein [Bacteroidales bacterium]
MKRIIIYLCCLLIAAGLPVGLLVSCNNEVDDLRNRVDDLEARVRMLETSLTALNGNIEALQVLAGGGTISSVGEKDGVYSITLSNGQVLTINQGSIGVGYAPIMTIDADGWWMADYQDGNGPQFVLDAAGQKVAARGSDGMTPRFGVDSEGYWTVSYDGTAYTRVTDVDGNPAKAVTDESGEDSYFKDVRVEDDIFYLTLRNGEVYQVPVVKDFLCTIKDVETIQVFAPGEEKSFTMEMKGVVETFLSAPEGWTASLSSSLLTVKAPGTTKAVLADMAIDVTVLAISRQGYSAMAKVRVQLDGSAVGAEPKVGISVSEVTYEAVTFSVVVEDCTSWKYFFQSASQDAPGVARLLTDGTEGSEKTLKFNGLAEKTSYALYVLPINGDVFGPVASAIATTGAEPVAAYDDNYTAYQEGKAIHIAGLKYDKVTWGEPVLVTATSTETDLREFIHDKTGIFFLEENEGCHFVSVKTAQTQITKDVILISRYKDKPVTYKPGRYHNLRKGGTFAVKDIIIDLDNLTEAYFCNFTSVADGGPLANLHFDGCDFLTGAAKQLTYSTNHVLVRSIRFYNCYIESTKAGRMDFISLSSNPYLDNVKEIVFHNNIFYNPNTSGALTLFGSTMAAPVSGNTQETDITLSQNTFYGTAGSNVLIQVSGARSLTVSRNLFYAPEGQTAHTFVLRTNVEGEVECQVDDNIAYGAPDTEITHSNSIFKLTEGNRVPKVADDPMMDADPAKRDFTPIAKYIDYGAQR